MRKCQRDSNYILYLFYKLPGSGGTRTPVIPALWEAEAGGFLCSRPAWSTERVPGQPGLHKEILSRKNKTKQKKNQKTKTNKQTNKKTKNKLKTL